MSEYIDKIEVMKAVCRYCVADGECDKEKDSCADYECFSRIPLADVAPVKHGKWVELPRTNVMDEDRFVCSECGNEPWWCGVTEEILPLYCPWCGAEMDKEDGSEDG